ncbi:MAG TPA: hypothetical protein VGJ12_08930 [Gemmatimonadaceae bacterium]|jgi:hypothetical protein
MPLVLGMVIFFAVAHLDRHAQRQSFRSHLRRASPLYVLSTCLLALMISEWNEPGFGEFVDIFLLPFELFFGGILGDIVYCLGARGQGRP